MESCNAADSGTLRGDETTGGDTSPPKMAGTDRNRLEAGAGEEKKRGGGGRKDRKKKTVGTTTATPETELSDS